MPDVAPRPTTVDFHFDVMCPFAYQTAKWIREVRRQNDLVIEWKFFSLEEVNRVEGKNRRCRWVRPLAAPYIAPH